MRASNARHGDQGPRPGVVYLVGAGPGDPGLLTLRAAELIAEADDVYFDHLVSSGVLSRCGAQAQLIAVGKIGHGPQSLQSEIERELIGAARAGRRVVRLKGGDPLLFGRGSEEALALRAAGIAFEIVPGVSSALAVPAYAGIPLTARGIASSVAIVTGHTTAGAPAPIPMADTIVVLMGVSNAAVIRDQLLALGRAPDTPAAVIEHGTSDRQRVAVGTLGELPEIVARGLFVAPSILIVGEVVGLREHLEWWSPSGGARQTVMSVFSKAPDI